MEYCPLPYHCIHKVGVSIELVLDDVVQKLQQENHQIVVGGVGHQKPGGGEGLDEMEQLAGGRHRH